MPGWNTHWPFTQFNEAETTAPSGWSGPPWLTLNCINACPPGGAVQVTTRTEQPFGPTIGPGVVGVTVFTLSPGVSVIVASVQVVQGFTVVVVVVVVVVVDVVVVVIGAGVVVIIGAGVVVVIGVRVVLVLGHCIVIWKVKKSHEEKFGY